MTNKEFKSDGREYILAYGFRRYSACKKLGWSTIPCWIKSENRMADIPIDDIYVIDNTRVEDRSEEFLELMQSIKSNGLLQPIGVWHSNELTEEDFLVNNLIENLQRKDISPAEMLKGIIRLKDLGLNNSEIMIRLSISKSKLDNLMRLAASFPKDMMKEVAFSNGNNKNMKGKMSVTTVNEIANMRINKADKETLFREAKAKELSHYDVRVIADMIRTGFTMREALLRREEFKSSTISIVVKKEELKNLNSTFSQYVYDVLKGKRKPIPSLIS